MSKENAIKFCELIGKNPEILKEGEKHDKGQGDVYVIFSDLAKEKGFDCEASELKEVMDQAQNTTSELDIDDLENVAGGASTDQKMLTGISAIAAFTNTIMNSKGADGKINWKDPNMYINGGVAALGAGVGTWMSYGNNGGNDTKK